MKPFRRRTVIRAVSYLAAVFVVLGGFAVSKHLEARQYRQFVQNSYQHAFAELTSAMGEISTALQKGTYATTPSMISSLCTQVFGKAMAAQMSMGELPYANVELEQTAAFIAKVGDYTYALSRSSLSGGYTQQDQENISALARQASSLSQQLQQLQADVLSGTLTLEDVPAAEARLSASTEEGDITGGSAFQDIESEFPEMPTLIYDGPFSQHLEGRTPAMLDGRQEVSQEEALNAAASFTGLKPDIFQLLSTVEGDIPSYLFSAAVDGGTLTVEVTRAGGLVMNLFNSRTIGSPTLSAEDGVALARTYLEERGYADMQESYYLDQGNILTVNFAFRQGDVLCYPDLVKVSVALDNGRVVGFESQGYLMSHTVRDLPEAAVTLAQAQAKISPLLHQLSHQLVVIPTEGEHERLCWEFKCQTEEGQHYLIYLNAQTGQEERILILLEEEAGTLVM